MGMSFESRPGLFESALHNYQPIGSFRVSRPGFVQQESFVINQTGSSHPVPLIQMLLNGPTGCRPQEMKMALPRCG